jgi:hypothetical protein
MGQYTKKDSHFHRLRWRAMLLDIQSADSDIVSTAH